jgi:bifunctional ADP-heptose synthase (sugar kinase/adenylyltransferase)
MNPKNILIIGEVSQDIFIYGDANYRLNPEAPCPCYKPLRATRNKGMAGNTFANLMNMRYAFKNTFNIYHSFSDNNIKKTRYIDSKSGQMIMRLDSNDSVMRIKDLDTLGLRHYDVVLVSDYDKGFLNHEDLNYIAQNSNISILDTKKKDGSNWLRDFTFIKVNEAEFESNKAMKSGNYDNIIVTLGAKGCRFRDKIYSSNHVVDLPNVAGAGDTFMAALGYCALTIDHNETYDRIFEFCNDCCSKVVAKKGVATPFENV